MFVALVGVLVCASPAPKELAVTRFRLVQVNEQLGGFIEDRLAQRLSARGFQVTTPADLTAVLGVERQRQLLGCTDDLACVAEISAALGVAYIVSGRLTRLGRRYELDVRVLSQAQARVIATATEAVDDEAQLGAAVESAADAVATQLLPATPVRWRLWAPTLVGVAAALGGGAVVVVAETGYASWTTPGSGASAVLRNEQIADTFRQLSTQRVIGFSLLGVGAALIATGLLWNALVPSTPVQVAVQWTPNGTTLALGATF